MTIIRQILFGSTAALLTASSARAADSFVIAEPEPVEYVRVCDVYGSGFYYIPGTETCLKIGGHMRYDIGVGDMLGNVSYDKKDWWQDGAYNENDTYYKRARLQLELDARTETELGTLRAYAALRFQYTNGQGSALLADDDPTTPDINETLVGPVTGTESETLIRAAYIELGGFRIGKDESAFMTFMDYAGTIINDDIVPFGPYDTNLISYTFNSNNGFSAMISLEEGSGSYFGPGVAIADAYTLDDYVPHGVAGVGYTGGWGSLRAVAAYDAVWEEFAAKVKLDIQASEQLWLFAMAGYKSAEDVNGVEDAGPNFYGNWGGTWAIWGGGQWKFTEKAALNVQLSYDDYEDFAAVAGVDYELVPGFKITPEVVYADNFNDDLGDDDDGEFGGFLRFQRDF